MNERLSSVLSAAKGYNAVIITDSIARRYLIGFDSSDAGTLVITEDRAVFIIDARYYEAAQGLDAVEVVLQKKLYDQLNSLVKGKAAVMSSITVGELNMLRSKLECTVEAVEEIDSTLSSLRAVKSKQELADILEAQRLAESAFSNILGFIKEGVTELEIAAELEYIMRRGGAERMSFDTIAVSGSASSVPHGVPTQKRVQAGDFVTMDFGAVINGCRSDMTRTVAVGFATDEMQRVYNTVLSAQHAAISAVRSGAKCSDVDNAARTVIANNGYGEYFTHSIGHGVGFEIHEAPTLSPNSTAELKSGNVITIEPGIYIPSHFGVRIEDMLYVTDNGGENLTKAPKELIIV